ncbi:GAF domain-containing protein [Marinobacterium aestuariivivens]|uniref:GAF domain-containing protein n=1 Tax=Marinobacterium aestuariivivens TaxID=1698799 RepID=A0ABW2A7A1_9GAMM
MNALLSLDRLRNCLEGVVPAGVATCDDHGMPNVTYVSQVMYVDPQHVALSYQFFNKTRANILANPQATALVLDPDTAARYRLRLRYLRTETCGPLFEGMKARLAGIASHEGMTGVFRLRGADIYRVLGIEAIPGRELPANLPAPAILPALRRSSDALNGCRTLDSLFDGLLDCLLREFGLQHAMLLIADLAASSLYVVASRGYPHSGIGAEIPLGVGVIGIAARERVPIRIMYAAAEYAYTRAVREEAIRSGLVRSLEEVIPLPGLPDPQSQLAIPLLCGKELAGVLYSESLEECRFGYDIEDALVTLCAQAGHALRLLQLQGEEALEAPVASTRRAPQGPALQIEYYPRDHSLFMDGDYLIKGVAGAILWELLHEYRDRGRTEFSNRELRRNPRLGLPDICDNLEARLILLTRRLVERQAPVRLEKSGRGRFRLTLKRPLQLHRRS